jgi:hypothetical protein
MRIGHSSIVLCFYLQLPFQQLDDPSRIRNCVSQSRLLERAAITESACHHEE